jgi:hypothetical protein
MKSTFYFIAILAFSALMLSPAKEKIYPSKEVIQKKIEADKKEERLNLLIAKIERKLSENEAYIKSSKNKKK